jgi:hypothetical protein
MFERRGRDRHHHASSKILTPHMHCLKNNLFKKNRFFFVRYPDFFMDPGTHLKFKIYHAKWTLRIEVVNGKKIYLLLYFQSLFSNRN